MRHTIIVSVASLFILTLGGCSQSPDTAWTPLNNVLVAPTSAAQNNALMQTLNADGQILNQQANAVKQAIAAEKGSL